MQDDIAEAKNLLLAAGDSQGAEQIARLAESGSRQPWRACLAGGFSRGKTHLLNQLLNCDIFPEDVIPATTVLTEVSYGEKPALDFISGASIQHYDLSLSNLEKFCAGQEYGDSAGILQAKLPAPLLYPDLHIYDTPGIDDIISSRAEITLASLESCDAALVLVSATSPLGMNEREFIESYLFERKIPRIALVVSFLDQLTPEQAQRQIEHIRSTAHNISPAIEIWSPLPGEYNADICGIEQIRERLKSWSTDPQLAAMRQKRTAASVVHILESFKSGQEALLRDLSSDIKKREADLGQALRQLNEQAEGWTKIRNEFMDAGQRCSGRLQKLAMELVSQYGDQDANMGDKLASISRKLAETAQSSIDSDIESMLKTIQATYNYQPELVRNIKITPKLPPRAMTGTENMNTIFAQGLEFIEEHIDTAVQWLPLPPPARILAREIGRRIIRYGREMLGAPMGNAQARLERFGMEIERDIRKATGSIYSALAERIRIDQIGWIETQQRKLEMASGKAEKEQEMQACRHNIASAAALLEQFRKQVQP